MSLSIAIIGYEEPLAEQLLSQLETAEISLSDIYLLSANEQEDSQTVRFKNKNLSVKPIDEFDWHSADVIYLLGNAPEYIKLIQENKQQAYKLVDLRNSVMKDKSLPVYSERTEILSHVVCADDMTALLSKIMKPLFEETAINSINVVALQPVSASSHKGPEGLASEIARLMNGRPLENEEGQAQKAFNTVPAIETSLFFDELKQIFPQENLTGAVTTLNVPVFFGSTLVVDFDLEDPLPKQTLLDLITQYEGVELTAEQLTPVTHGSNQDIAYMTFTSPDAEETQRFRLLIVADLPKCGRLKDALAITEFFDANNQSIQH